MHLRNRMNRLDKYHENRKKFARSSKPSRKRGYRLFSLVVRKVHKSHYGHSENTRGLIRGFFPVSGGTFSTTRMIRTCCVQPTYTDRGSEAGTKRASVWMLIWIMYRTGSRHRGREGMEGRKRKLELDTHRIMKAAIYDRARRVREEKEEPSREGAFRSWKNIRDEKWISHEV